MNIQDDRARNRTLFSQLKPGMTYTVDSNFHTIYMKVESTNGFNSVNVQNGKVKTFGEDIAVNVVNSTVVLS